MGIPGPPKELEWLTFVLVGENWPQGDEDLMESLGQTWRDFGAALGPLPTQLQSVVRALEYAGQGPALRAALEYLRQISGDSQPVLPDVLAAIDGVADGAHTLAVEIQYAKLMIIAFSAMLLYALMKLAYLAFITGGLSTLGAAAVVESLRQMARTLLLRVIRSAAMGAAMMASLDAGVQLFQIFFLKSRSWDEYSIDRTLLMGGLGALGGAVFSALRFVHRLPIGQFIPTVFVSAVSEAVPEAVPQPGGGAPDTGPRGGVTGGIVSGALEGARDYFTAMFRRRLTALPDGMTPALDQAFGQVRQIGPAPDILSTVQPSSPDNGGATGPVERPSGHSGQSDLISLPQTENGPPQGLPDTTSSAGDQRAGVAGDGNPGPASSPAPTAVASGVSANGHPGELSQAAGQQQRAGGQVPSGPVASPVTGSQPQVGSAGVGTAQVQPIASTTGESVLANAIFDPADATSPGRIEVGDVEGFTSLVADIKHDVSGWPELTNEGERYWNAWANGMHQGLGPNPSPSMLDASSPGWHAVVGDFDRLRSTVTDPALQSYAWAGLTYVHKAYERVAHEAAVSATAAQESLAGEKLVRMYAELTARARTEFLAAVRNAVQSGSFTEASVQGSVSQLTGEQRLQQAGMDALTELFAPAPDSTPVFTTTTTTTTTASTRLPELSATTSSARTEPTSSAVVGVSATASAPSRPGDPLLAWERLPELVGNLGRKDDPHWRLTDADLRWLWDNRPALRDQDVERVANELKLLNRSRLLDSLPSTKAPGLLGGSRLPGIPEEEEYELEPLNSQFSGASVDFVPRIVSRGDPGWDAATSSRDRTDGSERLDLRVPPTPNPDEITEAPHPASSSRVAAYSAPGPSTLVPSRGLYVLAEESELENSDSDPDPDSSDDESEASDTSGVQLSAVTWAAQMVPVLELRLEMARQTGSPGVAALEEALAQLRASVEAARPPGTVVGDNVLDRLMAASPDQTMRWLESSAVEAARLRGLARSSADAAKVALLRAAILFEAFPAWAGAVGRPGDRLASVDFLPMIQEVFGLDRAVADEWLPKLDSHIAKLSSDGSPVNLPALVRLQAFSNVNTALLPAEIANNIHAVVPAATPAGEERRTELHALISELDGLTAFDPSKVEHVRTLNRLVTATYRHLDKHHFGERPPGPLGPAELELLLAHKLGEGVPFSWTHLETVASRVANGDKWREDHRIFAGLRKAAASGVKRVGLSGLQAFRRKSAARIAALEKESGRSDSLDAREREARQLWKAIARALPHTVVTAGPDRTMAVTLDATAPDGGTTVMVSQTALADLVKVRRDAYADPRNRGYDSLAAYAPMVLEVLGASGPVSSTDVVRLVEALTKARSSFPNGLAGIVSWFGSMTSGRYARRLLVESTLRGWNSTMPGPRPSLPPGTATDDGHMMSAFHTIGELNFVPQLSRWLNGIVPLADGAIEEDVVRRKLTSLFAQTTDDGSPFIVRTDGHTFDVRLWAIPVKPPEVRKDSLAPLKTPGSSRFKGKQENRIYQYADTALWSASNTTQSVDVGPAYRLGFDPALGTESGLSGVDTTWTLGGSWTDAKRQLTGVSLARYQFQRIKEPLGWVDMDVAWVARVQDRDTGAWKDFTWLGMDGNPRVDRVPYSVAEFALPYSKEQVENELSPDQQNKIDKDYLVPQAVTADRPFPLWEIDHAVSRVQLADEVLAGLRNAETADGKPVLLPEDYLFWKPVVETYLTNDAMAMALPDILRPRRDGDRDFQSAFRVLLERDGRTLSLSINNDKPHPISSVTPISEISRLMETRFDQILAVVVKSLFSGDKSRSGRSTLTSVFRFVADLLRLSARGNVTPWSSGEQLIRHHRSWLTRAKRLPDPLRTLYLQFGANLDVTHTKGGEERSGHVELHGYAHVMVAAATFRSLGFASEPKLQAHIDEDLREDTEAEAKAKPDPSKAWWSLGKGFGIGMDYVDSIGGVSQLYNEIVLAAVDAGYLPEEASGRVAGAAAGGVDRTPYEYLQTLPLTGETLNKPGIKYQNWVRLVEQLSERSLAIRADDVFGRDDGELGVVVTLAAEGAPTERSQDLVITLGAEFSAAGQHDGVHRYQIQYGHTSVDTIAAKRSRGRGYDGGLLAAVNAISRMVPWRGQGGGQGSASQTGKFGRNQSTAITSDTDGQKMSSARYHVPIQWEWAAQVNGRDVGQGEFAAEITLYQPDELHDRSGRAARPGLRTTDGSPLDLDPEAKDDPGTSVLSDMSTAVFTVIGAAGVGALRKALVKAGMSNVDARRDLTKTVYKTAAMRSLAGVATVPVGGEPPLLVTTPIGRPRVEKVWFPYTQQVLEGQAGKEQAFDRGSSGGWSAATGPSLGPVSFMGGYGRDRGSGTSKSDLYTVGSYRGIYQDTEMAVVRTAVVNKVTLPDGRVEHRRGQVLLNVLLSDVLARRDEFDDPDGLLPAKTPPAPNTLDSPLTRALTTTIDPPLSLTHGFGWSVVWPMLFGNRSAHVGLANLATSLANDARLAGGAALASQLASVASWLSPYMAKLRDGGAMWEFKVGSRVYELVMTARLVGPGRDGRDGPTGEKLYTRGNQYADEGVKTNQAQTRQGTVVASPEGLLANFTSSETTKIEQTAARGSNLLFMFGVRANKLSDFNQLVQFDYVIRERSFTSLLTRPKQASGTVLEELVVSVPQEGTLTHGHRPVGMGLALRQGRMPREYRLTGIYGVQSIFDAVQRSGEGKIVDASRVALADNQITYENLPDKLPQMLSAEGAPVRAVVTADKMARLGADMRVKARFGPVQQIYFMQKAELEKYDHGTDLAASSTTQADIKRQDGGGNYTPIPVGTGWVGVRAAYSRQKGEISGKDSTDWIEHRAWLRADTSVFFIYTTLEYEIVLPSGKTAKTVGAVELVVDQQGARELGVPLDVLKAAVPPAQHEAQFGNDKTPARAIPTQPDEISNDPADIAVVRSYRAVTDALTAAALPAQVDGAVAAILLHAHDAGVAVPAGAVTLSELQALMAERRAELLPPLSIGHISATEAALDRMQRAIDEVARLTAMRKELASASVLTPDPLPEIPSGADDWAKDLIRAYGTDSSPRTPEIDLDRTIDEDPEPLLHVPIVSGMYAFDDRVSDGDRENVVGTYAPWLAQVNANASPSTPEEKQANGFVATMAAHLSVLASLGGEDVVYQARDGAHATDRTYGKWEPVSMAAGFFTAEGVMAAAPDGAMAELGFTAPGSGYQQTVLVWKVDSETVLFLDAQTGTLAKLPMAAKNVTLKPFSEGLPVDYTPMSAPFFVSTPIENLLHKVGYP